MTFIKLGLNNSLLKSLQTEGYTTPTPIQKQAIPVIMEGKDLVGIAQTGTGKTAAFALPIIENLLAKKLAKPAPGAKKAGTVRCLVLTPTRELAQQVGDSFITYGKHANIKTVIVYGGVGIGKQKFDLSTPTDVLVATPGRLLDLVSQRMADLSQVEIFVLDEADRMFDMGFVRDIRKVVALIPKQRQTLLFSATMAKEIAELASSILQNPTRVEVSPLKTTAENIEQSVYHVEGPQKIKLLKHLIELHKVQRVIVFVRMKHLANRIAETLRKDGIESQAFHSNKSQNARIKTLASFKSGEVKVLIATDIAARGLDIDNIDVVVNYDLPDVPETYVHRIGRTARANAHGQAWSFCDSKQRPLLRDIERLTKQIIASVSEHPFLINTEAINSEPRPPNRERKPNAGREQRPASREQRPAGREQRPASREQRPASREQRPASREQRPASREQRPASREQRPASREQRPASREQRPASREQRTGFRKQ